MATLRLTHRTTPLTPETGLIFPSNGVSGSDIALDWTTDWDRFNHTSIWQANFASQSSFYAWDWEVYTDNAWHSGTGEFGAHPYPTDGNYDGDGHSTGDGGSVHYFEIANGFDLICNPSRSTVPKLVTKGVWYTQAKTCETTGGNYVHRFYPDLVNDPTYYIEWIVAVGTFGTPSMKHRNGASPWTASGSTNAECPSGTFRYLLKYTRGFSAAEVLAKLGRTTDDTTDPDVYYSNINPTPDDVADKSGSGHNPSWANANRPTLYTA